MEVFVNVKGKYNVELRVSFYDSNNELEAIKMTLANVSLDSLESLCNEATYQVLTLEKAIERTIAEKRKEASL